MIEFSFRLPENTAESVGNSEYIFCAVLWVRIHITS